jgi:hypothetical protein
MNVSGMMILRARLAQRLAYDVASSRYCSGLMMGTMAIFMAVYLIPSGRGMHTSLLGWMLLGSAQLLVLVLTTILLGGSGSGAWQGGSHCLAFDVSGGGSLEG